MNNFFLIVLDGIGVGELPDASYYNDEGSNTLGNLAKAIGGLSLPNLKRMGLGNIIDIDGVKKVKTPLASFGKMKEISKGKDSTTGHWELGGLFVDTDFSYFPDGFPDDLIEKFISKTGVGGVLGNKPASGTEIIKELGDEHIKTGYPIVYTSADSVFQIAAHEEKFGLDRLYEICRITRDEILVPPLIVGRVIARPFVGTGGNYSRTTNRKDYSLDSPSDTILDLLQKNGIRTISIGKISDLFNYKSIDVVEKTKSNLEGCNKLLEYSQKVNSSFIFTNLVDFDVYYGHRNDPFGLANALKEFDDFLPSFISKLDDSDRLIITSDHGNDPTTPSTDHSREFVPLLYHGKNKAAKNLGTRQTFSDAAKTVADYFKVENDLKGISFLNQ
ncbi:MAG: phosphopentomutase [Ignavibacteriaceae bacterium]|nr:phosphopentomutase [Ignavibacteriaceae bacterium]